MDTDDPDARRGPRPFAHVGTANAGLYRRVMGAFAAAKRRFTVHLRPEDVMEYMELSGGVTVAPETVVEALSSLEQWGNLRADPDTSRVTTVEDFHRARYLYQLTSEGAAAEAALAAYDEALGKRGALQRVALQDIVTQLRALLALTDADDEARTYYALDSLVTRFGDLADNAQAFMSSLQRTIDLHDAEVEAFLAYKDRLIGYLEQFIKELVSTRSEIAALIEELDRSGVHRLLDLAAARASRDAAPDGTDDAAAREFERQSIAWRERWDGFHDWFLSRPGHPSQAELLRNQARASIPRLLHVVTVLNDRRTGRSDRSADFRTLARWFAEAPDDAALHRLWRSAFGLHASRHLTVDTETLDARDRAPVPATTPWTDAPPILISPRLRQTGQYERRGRTNQVIDRGAQRRVLAERAAREAQQTAAARAALLAAVGERSRLSDLGVLDRGAFALFLTLLGGALAARTPGRRSASITTSDGSLTVTLTEIPGASIAVIEVDGGVFRGPDHTIEIIDNLAPPTEARSSKAEEPTLTTAVAR